MLLPRATLEKVKGRRTSIPDSPRQVPPNTLICILKDMAKQGEAKKKPLIAAAENVGKLPLSPSPFFCGVLLLLLLLLVAGSSYSYGACTRDKKPGWVGWGGEGVRSLQNFRNVWWLLAGFLSPSLRRRRGKQEHFSVRTSLLKKKHFGKTEGMVSEGTRTSLKVQLLPYMY